MEFSYYGQNGVWFVKINGEIQWNQEFRTKKDVFKAIAIAKESIHQFKLEEELKSPLTYKERALLGKGNK